MRDGESAGEHSLMDERCCVERARAGSGWGWSGGIRALAGFVALLVAFAFAATASAATITVNTTADNDHVSGDCMGSPGDCSLRQAFYNAAGTGDTVIVPSGNYTLTL